LFDDVIIFLVGELLSFGHEALGDWERLEKFGVKKVDNHS
jgi:hypothetical protein